MNYMTVASQLKAKHPEYANRDDRELVEKYIQRNPDKASFIEFDDYEETPTQTQQAQQEEPKKPITKEEVGDYLKGASQTLSQGLMLGQAPHVSGVLNESINTPQKVYNAQSLRDLVDVYKGLGKDYVKSREQFKEEQGKFEEENPKTALALEMIGGLGSTGGGLGLLRSGRSLLRQVLKGGLEGGAIGSMFGASNTKGKAIDFKNAGLGALLGGGLGSTLGFALPVGQKLALKSGDLIGTLGRLWGKGVDAVADRVTPVKYIKNPMREVGKAEEKLLASKEPIIDVEGVEVKPKTDLPIESVQNNNLPVESGVQNPLRETESAKLPTTKSRDILANPKNMDDAYSYGYVQDYLPEQNLVVNTLKKDNYVLEKVASGEDVGRHFDKFGEEAVEELRKVRDVVSKAENEAYKKAGITNDYMLEGNKFVNDVEEAIKKFKNDARTPKADEGAGDKFLNDVLEEWTKNDGQISFGMLKTFTKKVNQLKTQVRKNNAKGDSSSEYDLWKDISRIISDTKSADANLKAPNKMYSELSKAIEDFEYNTGIDFDKPKNMAKNIFTSARDRADGGVYEQALDNFIDVLDKYDGTKILGDLPSKVRMAKVSYVLRPSAKDSKLSRDVKGALNPEGFAKKKLAEALVGRELSSEEYYRILARKMLKGEITPQQLEGKFRKVRFKGMSEDESNELLVKYLLLGKEGTGTVPSILAGMVKGGIK